MKYALRYLWRNKVATGINVSGLAVALSAAFLMLQYLDFELSYDTWLPEHNEVYRVATEQRQDGVVNRTTAETYYGLADWITPNFDEVEAATRVNTWPANTGFSIEVDGKLFNEKNYLIADKGFFKVFPSWLISGNADKCLDGPDFILLSDVLALKIFGTTDIVGKTIINPSWRGHNFIITGVFRKPPVNSQLYTDIIQAYAWVPEAKDQWTVTVWTYLRVDEGTDVTSLQDRLNTAAAPMLPDPHITASFSLQPLSSIHLESNLEDEIKTPGNITNIYIVFGALMMIMLIAWVNYINLETARFINRLKEVGIRRIIGSSKRRLMRRFLTEFLLVTLIALILAILIVYTTFPWFGYVTGLPLTTFNFNVKSLWFISVAVVVVSMLIAGTLPFLSLLDLNPIESLKRRFISSNNFARRSLLTFQFVSSLTLMALVVMVSFQLDFMRNIKKELDINGVVTIYNSANYTYLEDSLRQEKNEFFRNRLLQIPSVSALTTSSAIPGEPIGFTYTDLAKRSLSDPDRQVHYKVMYIDYDFIPLFGLTLVAGRNYSREFADTNCLVVTESTIKELGFKSADEALNEKIYFQEDAWEPWTIIGIVKDYRHQSIKSPANPGIFRLHRNKGQMVYYSIRVSSADAIPVIEKLWKETWPGKPFEYFFMDQHYDQQYKSEIHFSRVFIFFSAVAMFIACLGIMGISLFEANARIKEIGIRKVLGAEVKSILFLLTKGSVKLLLLSLLIATPLVYLLAGSWLTTYPERIDLSVWFMAAPFLALLTTVVFITTTQVLKTAIKNPIEALKQE